MTVETIGIIGVAGCAFVAATLGRVAYQRRMDVLYGPYVEGRPKLSLLSLIFSPPLPFVDRLRWRMRVEVCLTPTAPC